jgi:hypothetical protein
MDRDDKNILEDYYRYPISASRGYSHPLFPVLDGIIRGRPRFVAQKDRMGFEFGRREQYALLNPRVVDLGEATIVIDLLPRRRKAGTVFDLGTSKKNRMVLALGKDGVPQLTAVVNGRKAVSVRGSRALPAGRWSRLRVEIDGRTTSLWLAGKRIGSVKTAFRPCDVYAPDEVKFNVVGNSRDRESPLSAVIDSVVVYHTVHEDFASVPPPTTDSPIRPSKAIFAMHEKIHGNVQELNKKIAAESRKIMEVILAFRNQSAARREELLSRHKPLLEAREKLRKAPRGSTPQQIGALKKLVAEKESEAWQRYLPEAHWLGSFEYACVGRYYNQPYGNYVSRHVRARLGGGEMRENLGLLKNLVETVTKPDSWRTEVDWDWRMPEEISGKIDKLPIMKRWLLRARGPVVRKDPTKRSY